MNKSNKFKILFMICSLILVVLVSMKIFSGKNTKKEYISLSDDNIKLYVGDIFKLKVKTDGKYKFESEDENIITVDDNGLIKAVNVGKSGVKIVSESGEEKECVVFVSAKVNSLTTDNYNVVISPKMTKKLTYNLEPNDVKIEKIAWTSDDTAVATVSGGEVTGIKNGETTINLIINDKYRLKYNIIVVPSIEDFKIKDSRINININETKTIDLDLEPSTSDIELLSFKSKDESIAIVDNKGKVTGKKEGKTKIVISNGKEEKTITIKVKNIKVKSVSLNKNNGSLYLNETLNLDATVKPSDAFDSSITWSSSDEKIAIVKDGIVYPKSPGTVKITAKSSNDKKATCTVNVYGYTHNKDAIFFGDSIAYGLASTPKGYGWGNYIGDHFDIGSTVNAAKSGWLISNALDNSWINTIVKSYKDKKYDYVILHGGTNDIKHAVEMGEFKEDDFSGNYNEKTFIGGLETYIYTVKQQWPDAKIGYIITFATPNSVENRRKLSAKYYTAMKKVLDKWDIKYLDLYFGKTPSGKSYTDLLKVNTYEYLTDGIHLNIAGYKLLAPYIYDWMNTL